MLCEWRKREKCANHQNGPCEPVKVASVRNSLVRKITSSISSSMRLIPKSERMFPSAIRYVLLVPPVYGFISLSATCAAA